MLKIMKAKKITAILLTLLMLAPAFASCSDKNSDGGNNSQNADTSTTASGEVSDSASETEEEYPYNVVDYGGYTFRMLVRGQTYGFWESNEMYAEESNGEALNDAVYQRIIDIEDMYNVDIQQIKPTVSVNEEATKVIQAGEDAYDMILGTPGDASALSLNKLVLDLNTVNSLQLDMPWWDQAANEGLSIANKLYYTTGEISYDRYRATEAMLFNKAMLNEYNLEDPYQLVRDGKWTFDKVLEMSQGVSQDLDGNGKYDENDKYGMITYTNVVTSGIFASGIHYNTKDENDMPVLSFYSEKTAEVVEDYITFMIDDKLCFDWANYYHLDPDPNTNVGLVIFQENRALFNYNGIHAVPNLRNMFSDFGIVPLPKYDEAQETYYHCVNNTACPFIMIPVTSQDPERAGNIVEALAHKGRDLVKVAFYDITLKSKSSRDEQSAEMLDLIFDNMVYDIAFFGNFGDIGNLANNMMAAKNTNLSSEYAKIEKKVTKTMEKFIEDITEEE